jgi:hypothetical protein
MPPHDLLTASLWPIIRCRIIGVTACYAPPATINTRCARQTEEEAMRALLWPLLLVSLLVVGWASAPVHTDGVTGSVAWHATDFSWPGLPSKANLASGRP